MPVSSGKISEKFNEKIQKKFKRIDFKSKNDTPHFTNNKNFP